jgi:hypothetical protein
MLPAPRILAIDDDPKHLEGLARGLNQYGAACLQVHFTGDGDVRACPYVRVIFADLHLNEGGAGDNDARHFTMIGSLIEQKIVPAGPYLVVLWTRFADKAGALRDFLEARLQGVAKPVTVVALDKNLHLDLTNGELKSVTELVGAIESLVRSHAEIAALLNWEERVLGAAAETVSSVVGIAAAVAQPDQRASELRRLLACLGAEAVGDDHVQRDRFRAVNEALIPILADRVARLKGSPDADELWKTALQDQFPGPLSTAEAAKLNRFLHIADSAPGEKGGERGAVIELPGTYSGGSFTDYFGKAQSETAIDQFACTAYVDADARFRWVLVQVQAACDYAQVQPGPLPYFLGLEIEAAALTGKSAPAAVWTSPAYEFGATMKVLRVSARFHVSLSVAVAEQCAQLYRIREQLLNDLIYRHHGYGARPGTISFRKRNPPETPQASPPGATPAPGSTKVISAAPLAKAGSGSRKLARPRRAMAKRPKKKVS